METIDYLKYEKFTLPDDGYKYGKRDWWKD
jgi:hypothetical protein